MKKNLRIFYVVFFLVISWVAYGQEKTLTGKVVDDSNVPLPGVSVVIGGTSSGTITNVNGEYSISVNPDQTTLTFSFIGFQSQSVSVGSKTIINVTLHPENFGIEEVVVVGYGTAKKANLTSAQTAVTSNDIEKTVNTTVEQAIQGRSPGVYITQNSGQPGGNISVNIRGVSSINGNTEPLYIIDGVQMMGSGVSYGSASSSNPLAGINPADIADIQVLQGPSATAVYGSRATNGVLLITTKRGKEGDAIISYNYSYSLQTPPNSLDVMNLPEYASMVKEFHDQMGGTTPEEFLDPSILGNGTDWQKELFQNSAMKKHQISLAGGNEKTRYYLSGEYLDQDGVALGSGFKRYGFRVNTDNNPRKWLKINQTAAYSQINEVLTTSSEDVISNALQQTPQIPVKNIDGSWGGSDPVNGANQYAPVNPVAIAMTRTNTNLRRDLNGGVNLEATIIDGLVFRTALNGNVNYQNAIYFNPKQTIGWYNNATAKMSDLTTTSTYYGWNQQLNYQKQLKSHFFELMVLHESQEGTWKSNGQTIEGFLTNDVIDVAVGDQSTAAVTGGHNSWAMESYLGRLNYNFDEKYILQGTIRRDGSSNFGEENKWGWFPSLSGAWRISKESWFNVPVINELKIRVETGLTGNNGWGGVYSPMSAAQTEWGTGFLPGKMPNPELQWEETKTNNIGFNVNFLKNRIQVEGDLYQRLTDNLISDLPLPGFFGTSGNGGAGSPVTNLGSLENKGWGVSIMATAINSGSFKWDVSFNISGVKTKIKSLANKNGFYDRSSWWMNNWTQRAQVGQAPWLFMGYKYDGLFQSVDDINNSPVPVDGSGVRLPTNEDNVWVGDVKYKNMSGADGAEGVIDVNDRTVIGNPWPKFFGGLTNTFAYRNFDLSLLLTFNYGNDVYNYVKMINSNPNQINLSRNLLTSARNYARPVTDAEGNTYLSNAETDLPRLSYGPNGNWERFSDRWVEDGSFLKVRNLTIGYNFPKSLISKQMFIKDLRIAVSAQNLYTFTKYTGYDPEVGSYVGNNASSANQAIGMDSGRYPSTATYTFNVMLNF